MSRERCSDGNGGVHHSEHVPRDLEERLTRSSRVEAPAPPRTSTVRTILARPLALALVAVMAVGSVALWIGIPVAWLWAASHATKTQAPTLGPYLLVIVGVPVSMWIAGKLLFRTNRLYERVTGRQAEVRVRLPWHRSLRDSSTPGRRTTVLDVVMVGSVTVALVAFGIWFFFFAGSSLPGSP